MPPIQTLEELCKAVSHYSLEFREFLETLEISDQERELLALGHKEGRFYVFTANNRQWVRAGCKNFYSEDDPEAVNLYMSAFCRLCARGYIRHHIGPAFGLTDLGLQKANSLHFSQEDPAP